MADEIYDRPVGFPTPVELIRRIRDGFAAELGGLNEGAPEEVLQYVEERLEEELARVRAVRALYYGVPSGEG